MAPVWAAKPASRRGILTSTWSFLNSRLFQVIVLGLTSALCLLAGVIPQVPQVSAADTARYELWINGFPEPLYDIVRILHQVGLTRLAWSRLTLLTTVCVILVVLLYVLRTFFPGWIPPGPDWSSRVFHSRRGVKESLDVVARAAGISALTLYLPNRRSSIEGELTVTLASNQDLRRWWALLLFLSLSLLAGTSLAQRAQGFAVQENLVVGQTWQVHGRQQTTLTLESVSEQQAGTISRASVVKSTWKRSDLPGSALVTIANGKPASLQGVSLYQTGYGDALRLSVTDSAGTPLDLQLLSKDALVSRSLSLRFTESDEEHLVSLPNLNRILRIVQYASLPAQGISGRAVALQLYEAESSDLLQQQYMSESGSIELQDLTFEVAFEHYVTVKQQAVFWAWLYVLGIAGITISAFSLVVVRERTFWVLLREDNGSAVYSIWFQTAGASWMQPVFALINEEAVSDR